MSSPIAHCSLILAAWPPVRRRLPAGTPVSRKRLAVAAVLVALMAPDADLLMFPWAGPDLRTFHNYFSHSLLLAPIFGIAFGFLCRLLTGGRWTFYAIVGCLCYVSHILVDAVTWGRGVQMFWPLTDQRFSAPFCLFYGVRHSVGAPWTSYLITVANDLGFGVVVWLLTRRLRRVRESE